MSLISSKRLPCGHGRVKFPEEEATHERSCNVCGGQWYAYVMRCPYIETRTGIPAFKIVWERVDEKFVRHARWDEAETGRTRSYRKSKDREQIAVEDGTVVRVSRKASRKLNGVVVQLTSNPKRHEVGPRKLPVEVSRSRVRFG